MRTILLVATLTLAQAQAGSSQAAPSPCWIRGPADKLAERPSPLDSIAVQVGSGTVKLCYSRPSARGRKVMGGLVPFDQPWRLGANEATSIRVPFAAEIAGVRVDPGTYTLYAIPGAAGRSYRQGSARGGRGRRHRDHGVARRARRNAHAQVRAARGQHDRAGLGVGEDACTDSDSPHIRLTRVVRRSRLHPHMRTAPMCCPICCRNRQPQGWTDATAHPVTI